MKEHPAIPRLTPPESAMAIRASTSEHVELAFVFAYLHWNKARGDMLANLAVQGRLLASVSKEGVQHGES